MVPDLSIPKMVDGKLYCWDRANKEIVEINMTPVNLAHCSKRIIAAFVDDGSSLGDDAGTYIGR
jgi:hypothetical protein